MDVAKVFPFRRKLAQPPRVRLLCLPFAGGAASQYRSWPARLAPAIDVCPIELPGRGLRQHEPPVADIDLLCEQLASAAAPLATDVPLALFGHSMGARIAFELARCLGERVVHLFAAGSPPPGLRSEYPGNDSRPTEQLTDAELKQRLRDLGGTPLELLDDDDLMLRALPIVRADLVLIERYQVDPHARVACPITVLAGTQDTDGSPAIAAGWQLRTTAAFRMVELDAGHFFLDSHRTDVLREIEHALAPPV